MWELRYTPSSSAATLKKLDGPLPIELPKIFRVKFLARSRECTRGSPGLGMVTLCRFGGGDIWVLKAGTAVSMAGSPLGPLEWIGLPPREAPQ